MGEKVAQKKAFLLDDAGDRHGPHHRGLGWGRQAVFKGCLDFRARTAIITTINPRLTFVGRVFAFIAKADKL